MLFVLLFFFISTTHALPQGAPESVCNTMTPNHGGGIIAQNSQSPYTIRTYPNTLGVLVSIESPTEFEGFMLQARNPQGQVVGTFNGVEGQARTMNCDGSFSNSLTHISTNPKKNLQMQWISTNYEGPVTFNATVAKDYTTFWVGLQSQKIQATRSKVTANTTPFFKPETKTEPSANFDSFYDDCGVKKTCFGSPDGCVNSKNCLAMVTVTVYGDRYEFEMKADSTAKYVAFGLSDDAMMGDDSVVECVKEDGAVKSYMSWTTPRSKRLGIYRLQDQSGIQLLSYSLVNDVINCRVQRDAVTKVNGQDFDLVNTKYHLLIAAGTGASSTSVGIHDITKLPSGEKLLLSDITEVEGASKILLRLHGAFMLAAWLGTASIGTLIARYFRQTWVGSTICGKDLWFAWHRLFMVLTWALTTAGFILIFVELKAWSAESNPHAILGLITTILCFIQPIGAYFRPHPGTSKRPFFNWLHWLGGNVAHIIAIVAIFFAVRLSKAELPEWMDWILVAYVAFHVVMHIILSILSCVSEKHAERRVTSFPMKDLAGSGRTSSYSDRGGDAPLSRVRKALLALYILIILCLVIVLIFISVVAPVNDFWESVQSTFQSGSN